MCPLLRGDFRRAVPRRAGSSVRARVRPATPPGTPTSAARLEAPEADLRKLNERPLPRGYPRKLHRRGLFCHEASVVAHVPGADQALEASGGTRARPPLAEKRLDG